MGELEYLKEKAKLYKTELDIIIGKSKYQIPLGKEYCISCDPRFKLLMSPERTLNNLLLKQQLSFKNNRLIFRRSYKSTKQYLNPLKYDSMKQTVRIANKLVNFPLILQEFNHRFASDITSKKLFFLDTYLKENKINHKTYNYGYLPLLMAFNLNSSSTPCRMVQSPNRQARCIIPGKLKTNNDNIFTNANGHNTNKGIINKLNPPLTTLSYNDTIRDYHLQLLGQNQITVNHLLTMSPIFGDVRDGFGKIILHPETALSCQIFLYKDRNDFLPTLDLSKACLDKNNEPILFPLVYNSSSYGTKDLPMIFNFAMTQCVPMYKIYSDNLISAPRLSMVEKILSEAYVDDISSHLFKNSQINYFIHAYEEEDRLKLIKDNLPQFKKPNFMIKSEENFNEELSKLSTSEFDEFLMKFNQMINLQISTDITTILKFCGFYLKAWESLNSNHTKSLNINLPKENLASNVSRPRPEVKDTHQEIHKLQKTKSHSDTDLLTDVSQSVTQLGRKLFQWEYTVKSTVASFQSKSHQKVILRALKKLQIT